MFRPIRRHGPHGPDPRPVGVTLPRVELEITRGRARRRLRPIDGLAYLIGAADDNDLVLADPQFPDSHSYLLRSPLGLTLCWLGEGPDVTVNGTPVLSTALVPADARLRTGPYEFRIRLSWPADDDGDDDGHAVLAGPHDVVTADRGAGLVFETPVAPKHSYREHVE
jgi:hypothetical protein